MLKVHDKPVLGEEGTLALTLDELAREGARRMLAAALEAEVAAYIEEHQDKRDEQGRRLVVRNGKAQARTVTLGAGTVQVQAPRVDDRRVDETGQRQRFTSQILPPYMRRARRRWPRCCRSCTCAACPRGTSERPCRCCWASRPRGCRRRPSRG